VTKLADLVAPLAEKASFAGVVRVDVAGETRYEAAFGLADRAHGLAMRTDSQLAIASGSKAMTALAVMSLLDEGALDLSTTARSVLGDDLPLIAPDVTVEHLLAHRSGIGDYLDEDDGWQPSDYVLPVPVHQLATTEAFLPVIDGFPTAFAAGERFSYCNGGYIVLALLTERASGVPYHDLVERRVLAPAGMSDSGFLRTDDLPGRAALGYVQGDGGWRTNVFHLPVRGNGDGGLYTTLADVHRFWAALMAGRILPTPVVRQMLRPRSTVDVDGDCYGLGFWLSDTDDTVTLDGGDAGVSFRSVHSPTAQITYTVIATTYEGASPIIRAIKAHLASGNAE